MTTQSTNIVHNTYIIRLSIKHWPQRDRFKEVSIHQSVQDFWVKSADAIEVWHARTDEFKLKQQSVKTIQCRLLRWSVFIYTPIHVKILPQCYKQTTNGVPKELKDTENNTTQKDNISSIMFVLFTLRLILQWQTHSLSSHFMNCEHKTYTHRNSLSFMICNSRYYRCRAVGEWMMSLNLPYRVCLWNKQFQTSKQGVVLLNP